MSKSIPTILLFLHLLVIANSTLSDFEQCQQELTQTEGFNFNIPDIFHGWSQIYNCANTQFICFNYIEKLEAKCSDTQGKLIVVHNQGDSNCYDGCSCSYTTKKSSYASGWRYGSIHSCNRVLSNVEQCKLEFSRMVPVHVAFPQIGFTGYTNITYCDRNRQVICLTASKKEYTTQLKVKCSEEKNQVEVYWKKEDGQYSSWNCNNSFYDTGWRYGSINSCTLSNGAKCRLQFSRMLPVHVAFPKISFTGYTDITYCDRNRQVICLTASKKPYTTQLKVKCTEEKKQVEVYWKKEDGQYSSWNCSNSNSFYDKPHTEIRECSVSTIDVSRQTCQFDFADINKAQYGSAGDDVSFHHELDGSNNVDYWMWKKPNVKDTVGTAGYWMAGYCRNQNKIKINYYIVSKDSASDYPLTGCLCSYKITKPVSGPVYAVINNCTTISGPIGTPCDTRAQYLQADVEQKNANDIVSTIWSIYYYLKNIWSRFIGLIT